MKDTLKLLGLKQDFDFREVQIDYGGDILGVHDVLQFNVMPAIIEMDTMINGFHFIRHEMLDLRISSPCWERYGDQITEVLANHKLSTEMRHYKMAKPEKFGGEIGRLLGYNVLEHNSRVILALISAKEQDVEERRALVSNIYEHWPHYLYCQYGFNNMQQARLDFNSAMAWAETALARYPDSQEFFDTINHILDGTTILSKKCLYVWQNEEENVA